MNKLALSLLAQILPMLLNSEKAGIMTWEEKEKAIREAMAERGLEEDLDEFLSWFELKMEEAGPCSKGIGANGRGNTRTRGHKKLIEEGAP